MHEAEAGLPVAGQGLVTSCLVRVVLEGTWEGKSSGSMSVPM